MAAAFLSGIVESAPEGFDIQGTIYYDEKGFKLTGRFKDIS
jgi:hypothetical protein